MRAQASNKDGKKLYVAIFLTVKLICTSHLLLESNSLIYSYVYIYMYIGAVVIIST